MSGTGRGVHALGLPVSLKAPFPWFGGKRLVAGVVWERFGNVPNYIEPFAGSLAVPLGRPHVAKVETFNDLDCYVANFWRALKHDPAEVARWCDDPVNETDLHARHVWLVNTGAERIEKLKTDPDFYDAKVAGWWVYGLCAWIGSEWCKKPEWTGRIHAAGNRGRGVHTVHKKKPFLSKRGGTIHDKRPALTGHTPGVGVHRMSLTQRLYLGGGAGGGSGIHAPSLSRQIPNLSGDSGSVGRGVHRATIVEVEGLYEWFFELSARLRRARVCCGDWRRVLTKSVTTYMGVTAVFLDPPYQHDLRKRCYSEDHDISAEVRTWAIANGENPKFRIALCGYEDEHNNPTLPAEQRMPASWECVTWKAHGGYSRTAEAVENRGQERIWFSPHCLRPSDRLPFEQPLFEETVSA